MKVLRTHTAKVFLACFIMAGMGLYLIHPAQAETSSHSFTRWLEGMVKKETAGDIQQQIYRLKQSEGSLAVLIEKASEMVSRNNDDFNLPISDKGTDTHEVYNLLIVGWNSYQTGNGMGKASGLETVKSNLAPTIDKFPRSLGIKVDRTADAGRSVLIRAAVISAAVAARTVEPLAGGIAIGAP